MVSRYNVSILRVNTVHVHKNEGIVYRSLGSMDHQVSMDTHFHMKHSAGKRALCHIANNEVSD